MTTGQSIKSSRTSNDMKDESDFSTQFKGSKKSEHLAHSFKENFKRPGFISSPMQNPRTSSCMNTIAYKKIENPVSSIYAEIMSRIDFDKIGYYACQAHPAGNRWKNRFRRESIKQFEENEDRKKDYNSFERSNSKENVSISGRKTSKESLDRISGDLGERSRSKQSVEKSIRSSRESNEKSIGKKSIDSVKPKLSVESLDRVLSDANDKSFGKKSLESAKRSQSKESLNRGSVSNEQNKSRKSLESSSKVSSGTNEKNQSRKSMEGGQGKMSKDSLNKFSHESNDKILSRKSMESITTKPSKESSNILLSDANERNLSRKSVEGSHLKLSKESLNKKSNDSYEKNTNRKSIESGQSKLSKGSQDKVSNKTNSTNMQSVKRSTTNSSDSNLLKSKLNQNDNKYSNVRSNALFKDKSSFEESIRTSKRSENMGLTNLVNPLKGSATYDLKTAESLNVDYNYQDKPRFENNDIEKKSVNITSDIRKVSTPYDLRTTELPSTTSDLRVKPQQIGNSKSYSFETNYINQFENDDIEKKSVNLVSDVRKVSTPYDLKTVELPNTTSDFRVKPQQLGNSKSYSFETNYINQFENTSLEKKAKDRMTADNFLKVSSDYDLKTIELPTSDINYSIKPSQSENESYMTNVVDHLDSIDKGQNNLMPSNVSRRTLSKLSNDQRKSVQLMDNKNVQSGNLAAQESTFGITTPYSEFFPSVRATSIESLSKARLKRSYSKEAEEDILKSLNECEYFNHNLRIRIESQNKIIANLTEKLKQHHIRNSQVVSTDIRRKSSPKVLIQLNIDATLTDSY